MNPINVLCHTSNTLSKYNIKKDSVSLSLVEFKIIQVPYWVPKMLHSNLKLLCLRYTEFTRYLAVPG